MEDRAQKLLVVFLILISSECLYCAILSKADTEQWSSTVKKLDINHARELLVRQRRSTGSVSDSVLSNEVILNGTQNHTQAYVHWSGKRKSEVVFILTLKYNRTGVADSQTWRSQDYGTSYHPVTFPGGSVISFFFVSPANHTKMVFTDTRNKKMYRSWDEMQNHEVVSLPSASDDIKMHPTNSDWMLLHDYIQRKLYVTINFGTNWTLLQTDVNPKIYWGVKGLDDEDVVHMEVQPEDSEQAYYKKCSIPDCHGDKRDDELGPFKTQTMLVIDKYIFVEKTILNESHSHMMVSYQRKSFHPAYFPDNVKTKDFQILSANEGQVFLAVNHGDRKGVSLYLSDPTGRYYVTSLENLHHRSADDYFDVDMHEVSGLNATFLANQRMNGSTASHRRLKTLVSFDKGGTWHEIPKKPKCVSKDPDECAILLRLDMASFFRYWILSEKNAPGFIIAHGHFGRNYEHDLKKMSVFTSVDGGWTWKESPLKGVYHFNILDQGSLVTAIKAGDQERTNFVYYSYDEGETWKNESFGKEALIVDGVLNEASINTLAVSIYGHENPKAPWTMVKLNFSQVLATQCNDTKDYEEWSPSDHDKNLDENCILGQRVSYKRKIRGSRCFNGIGFFRTVKNGTCACDDEDFECDFGFRRVNGDCQREQWFDTSYLPPECVKNQVYNQSKGYRKVGSDTCVNGVSSQAKYQPTVNVRCPVVAPAHLLLVPNVSVVATGKPIHFHLSQQRGSVITTNYTWNFNDSKAAPPVSGLHKAQSQVHGFSDPGVYHVRVSATNTNGSATSNLVTITVEDSVHSVAVYRTWATKVGFPVRVSVSTNVRKNNLSSLHFLYRFGDEVDSQNGQLTWYPNTTHVYTKAGTYTMSVTSLNAVSALTKQVTIKVIDKGVMLQLGFSSNVDQLFTTISHSNPGLYYVLESIRQELSLMMGLGLDRLSVNVNATSPVSLDLLVLPPPDNPPPGEISTDQIVKNIFDLVGNHSLHLFRSLGLPKRYGEIQVTSVRINKKASGGGGHAAHKRSGANMHAVYVAVPIVVLAGIVTVLVLIYYRKRYYSLRRYSMVNQNEDTDALLDDDDEPPLDLHSDSREEGRSRDDNMLDLGTGSHLVMVTGSGAGEGPEHC